MTYTYDSRFRVATKTTLAGRTLSYTYDDYDRVIRIDDTHGPTQHSVYDAMGRLIEKRVQAGSVVQKTTFTYDSRDRLVTITDALNRTTTYHYDPVKVMEKPSYVTDPAGRNTYFTYDSRQRLVAKIDAVNATTTYSYDLRGNLVAVTDANGNRTRYLYDDNNRKIGEERPSVLTNAQGATSSAVRREYFFYDAADRLVQSVTKSASGGADRVISYEYDSLDRMTRKVVQRTSSSTMVEDDSRFTYEPQLDATVIKSAVNGVANEQFASELAPPFATSAFSVAASVSGNPLGLLERSYTIARDVTGEISEVNVNGTPIFVKTYDPAARLTSALVGSSQGTTITYDGFSRRESVTHSSGEVGTFQYDLLNRVLNDSWSGPTPISEALGYDLAGNINSLQRENSANTTIGYDAVDQLLSSTGAYSSSYSYDGTGNRLQSASGGNGTFISNFLVSNAISAFRADTDGFGDVVKETTGSSAKNFFYRGDGRLSGFSSNGTQAAYYYDGLGRKVAKLFTGTVGSFGQSYVFLGLEDKILQARAGDGIVTTYLDGQGASDHLGEVRSGVYKGYVTDHLGSVLNSAAAGASHTFGLWGEQSASTTLPPVSASSDPVNYAYAGYDLDLATRLYHNGPRTYDPNTGTWGQMEPTGQDGPHLYHYAFNNPLLNTDPTGRNSRIVTQYGHEVVEVDDPDHPGEVVSVDLGPKRPFSVTDIYSASIPGKVNIYGGHAWKGYVIPGSEREQSIEDDKELLANARILQSKFANGELFYNWTGFNAYGTGYNCATFAIALQFSVGGKK